jgi:hypothetical protein
MRLRLIAAGRGTPEVIVLMMNEKVDALTQASTLLARVGNSGQTNDNYQVDCRGKCGTVVHIIQSGCL